MVDPSVSHRDEDGYLGPVYEQVVQDIWKQIPSRDVDTYYALTNRVLRLFLADPRLIDVLEEAGLWRV